jgi:SAM-dependent methyltransferase
MKYRELTKQEHEGALIQIISTLLDPQIPYSGAHRKKQWEKGWAQNSVKDITPKYFEKYKVNRLNGRFVYALEKSYEQKMLYSVLDPIFMKYFHIIDNVYEFGCGTGHNLLRVKKYRKNINLIGLDWVRSSVSLVRKMGMEAHLFDFFHPKEIKFNPYSAVLTVASLEQIGKNFKKFVDILLKNPPYLCIHVEPVEELLDPKNLLDYLSLSYFKKRKYLTGYLTYLRELEKDGKIVILESRRSGVGSLFIEGYSVIVWTPIL